MTPDIILIFWLVGVIINYPIYGYSFAKRYRTDVKVKNLFLGYFQEADFCKETDEWMVKALFIFWPIGLFLWILMGIIIWSSIGIKKGSDVVGLSKALYNFMNKKVG